MQLVAIQFLGILFLTIPLFAIQWNLAGNRARRANSFLDRRTHRWRIELYSNEPEIDRALVDRADIPFPVKEVKSARGRLAEIPGINNWALPRMELDLDVDDPFTDESLSGLFGPDLLVRFVTGNEIVLDTAEDYRVRLRALEFRAADA